MTNPQERIVDLHVHTNYSDGTFTPEKVVAYALKTNFSAIAITDHDSVEGIGPALTAAQGTGLEIVPGVELTAEYENVEIHIVGLMIDVKEKWFLEKLKEIRLARLERMKKMVEKLNDFHINIRLEDVLKYSDCGGSVGRLHLARALVDCGCAGSIREVFDRFIGNGKPCYVKRMIVSPQEALEMIRRLKGIPILAHPGIMNRDDLIPLLMENGLLGIEAFHIEHQKSQTNHYQEVAKKFNLLVSGGSDCHGDGKGTPLMGMVKVPYEVLENLKDARIKEYGIK